MDDIDEFDGWMLVLVGSRAQLARMDAAQICMDG